MTGRRIRRKVPQFVAFDGRRGLVLSHAGTGIRGNYARGWWAISDYERSAGSATSSIRRNFLVSGYACGERSGIPRRARRRVCFPRLGLWSLPSGFQIDNTRFGLVERPMQNGHQFRVDVQQKRSRPIEKTQSSYRPHRADCHVTSWKSAGFRYLRRKKNFLTVTLDAILTSPKSFVARRAVLAPAL